MNQTTKKQHYIWRSYLAPWTDDGSKTGTITCLRDKKIFSVSLTNIAHENYFYGIKELSALEKNVICEMTIKPVTGIQRKTNQGWLDLYCAPFDLADEVIRWRRAVGFPMDKAYIENTQTFKNWSIAYIENLHGQIESTGIQYLRLLRQHDLSFWRTETCRDAFSFFLCNQYFRTKRMRDVITTTFEKSKAAHKGFEELRPENMWLPLSLILASNVGAHIAHRYAAVLLQAGEGHFIVGDQPVINTHAAYNLASPPSNVELFYPITPHTALLLTADSKYHPEQTVKINAHEMKKYNELQVRASGELVFAKDRAQLVDRART